MKKFLLTSLIVTLIFAFAITSTSAEDLIICWNLAEYGQTTHIFGNSPTTAPTIDGVINASEYTSDPYSMNAPVQLDGGYASANVDYIKLYMSEDANYFYMAFEIKSGKGSASKIVSSLGFDMSGAYNTAMNRYNVTVNAQGETLVISDEILLYDTSGQFTATNGIGAVSNDRFSYVKTTTDTTTVEVIECSIDKSIIKQTFNIDTFSNTMSYYLSHFVMQDGADKGYGIFNRFLISGLVKSYIELDYGFAFSFVGNLIVLGTDSDLPYPSEAETTDTDTESQTTMGPKSNTTVVTTTGTHISGDTTGDTTNDVSTTIETQKSGCKSSFAVMGVLTISVFGGTALVISSKKKRD